jgi:hypothetical protein
MKAGAAHEKRAAACHFEEYELIVHAIHYHCRNEHKYKSLQVSHLEGYRQSGYDEESDFLDVWFKADSSLT